MGGQGDGASYTINLDTSAHAVEETAPGNYRIPTLSPTIDVPYAAVKKKKKRNMIVRNN
jgi:hypothetical protein